MHGIYSRKGGGVVEKVTRVASLHLPKLPEEGQPAEETEGDAKERRKANFLKTCEV